MYDRPADLSEGEFERRLGKILAKVPTIEEGHAQLQKYVNRWIAQLTERKELVTYREERLLQQELGLTQADVSAGSQTRARYLAQSDRAFNSAMRLMLALKADRYENGEGDLGDSEPQNNEGACGVATGPVETAPETTVVPTETAEKPNEPGASQLVAPETGTDEIFTPPAALKPAAAPVGIDAVQALIERGFQEFDDLREFDPIE
jgi:hypothetical protein